MHSPIIPLALTILCATNIAAYPQLKPYPRPRAANACPAMTVLFARGTNETGDLGSIAGPPLQTALTTKMASAGATIKITGIPSPAYPATITDAISGGSDSGSQAMASLAMTAMTNCPASMLVLAGYDQGGQIVHNAAMLLPPSSDVSQKMAVIFGDPFNGTEVTGVAPENTLVVCHDGDEVCENGMVVTEQHLSYGADVGMAAEWMVGRMMDVMQMKGGGGRNGTAMLDVVGGRNGTNVLDVSRGGRNATMLDVVGGGRNGTVSVTRRRKF